MSLREVVVVANGPLEWTPELTATVAESPLVVAADGGANHLARIGVRPAAVVGDLDSIDDDVRAWVGDDRLVPRRDQDLTDLEKALSYAFEACAAQSVTVLAALGGRIDHSIGNLGLLADRAAGQDLVFMESASLTWAVNGCADFESRPGETWSFWTFDPSILVTLRGVQWPLETRPLAPHQRPSISNRAVTEKVQVETEHGAVIVSRVIA